MFLVALFGIGTSLLSGCPPSSVAGSHGVSACCPERCGSCGGRGCELRPGGRAECCATTVRKANVACGRPPCVIDPTPTTVNISSVRRDLRSRRLVLFLHVPKAGGSSVMSYLSTGTVLFHYGLARSCFGHVLHADLFRKGDRIASTPPAWCLPKLLELAAAPRNKTVAVEFHDHSTGFFWSAAAEREGLMALYAQVITAATVREPRSNILSRYKFWPPYTWDKPAPRVAVPLLSWLKGLMEPALHQAKAYKTECVPAQEDGRCPTTATSTSPWPSSKSPRPSWAGTHKSVFTHTLAETWQATNSLVRRKINLVSDNDTCPPTQLVAAHLASLDLVCETSNLPRFLAHLSGLAGFTPGRVGDVHPGRGGVHMWQRVDRDLADAPGNATVQRALAAVAECDERWFKPTDWTRCEPNRAPQALPEAARKRYSPDYHPSSALGFD